MTVFGIVTDVSPVLPKAYLEMVFRPAGKLTEVRPAQRLKASVPMLMSDEGKLLMPHGGGVYDFTE